MYIHGRYVPRSGGVRGSAYRSGTIMKKSGISAEADR